MDTSKYSLFKDEIKLFYSNNKRMLPWREEITPYGVVVSELMLQQTQVPRVMQKYDEWMVFFPDFQSLAQASFPAVLRAWQGLGYNRRAKYVQQIAARVIREYGGVLPPDPTILETFPGIGSATARSIVVYTYNAPEIFIETNIRRIFIHHFFQDATDISDKQIYPLVEATLDRTNPREWYYALMDYGTYLATQVPNPNRKSKHYTKQSKFEGSRRQVRGAILKLLLEKGSLDEAGISGELEMEKERVTSVLEELYTEGFIIEYESRYSIKK